MREVAMVRAVEKWKSEVKNAKWTWSEVEWKLAPLCNLNCGILSIVIFTAKADLLNGYDLLWLVKRLTIELNSNFIETWLKWKCIGVRIGNYFLTPVLNVTPKWIFWTKTWFLIIITFAMFSYKLASSNSKWNLLYIWEREREREREGEKERAIRTFVLQTF